MPRHGIGIDISTLAGSEGVVTTIDDFVFESFSASQMHPILTTSRTNLIRNSNFATDSIWSKTNATINTSANKGVVTVTSGGFSALSQGITFEDGKTYTITAVINGTAGKEMRFQDHPSNIGGLTTSNGVITMTGSDQNVEITWVANSNSVEIVAARNTSSGSYSFDISRVQIEQDGFASAFIPTAGSTVTVTTTLNDTSNVWDFDGTDIMIEEDPESEGFWEESYPDGATLPELVLNGDYEDLGSNLVTNGTFDADANWTTATGWDINTTTKKAECDGSQSGNTTLVQQNGIKSVTLNIVNGKTYEVTFDVVVQAGVITLVEVGGGLDSTDISSSGTYTKTITASSTNGRLTFTVNSAFVGSIDNVTLKQVDPNNRWVLADGTTISDGKANLDGSSAFSTPLKQNSVMTVGDTYEATYTISNYSGSGSVKVFSSTTTNPARNADGTYTDIFVASGTSFDFQNGSTAITCSIDNVSVREYAIQPLDI